MATARSAGEVNEEGAPFKASARFLMTMNVAGNHDMKSRKTQRLKSLNEGKQMYAVDAFSPEDARAYAAKLFKLRVEGWGDENRALDECASMSRMTPLSFKRLMNGKIKEPTIGALARVRSAYLAYCEKLISRLQHEIEIEKRKHGDEPFEDLGAEAAVLMAKVQAAKSRAIG